MMDDDDEAIGRDIRGNEEEERRGLFIPIAPSLTRLSEWGRRVSPVIILGCLDFGYGMGKRKANRGGQ
jgi:hypothetical protein